MREVMKYGTCVMRGVMTDDMGWYMMCVMRWVMTHGMGWHMVHVMSVVMTHNSHSSTTPTPYPQTPLI